MAKFEKFAYKSLEDLESKIKELGVNLKLNKDLSPLSRGVKIGNTKTPNAIAILPMEGCDSNSDGSPSDLVFRRYKRFASGGAGLLWFEACAVVPEGKANPLQLSINQENIKSFKELVDMSNSEAKKACGENHVPVKILQLTHSGRYSKPNGKAEPIIAQHDPLLDPPVGAAGDYPVATDEYLDSLPEKYAKAAALAREAGFDGVDIKSCHRYLFSEVLSAFTREGKYGGSFENRTRLMLSTIEAVKKTVGNDFIIASRFNVFDSHPYPYGFGVDKDDCWKSDLTEPLKFVELLKKAGVNLLSNSAGNPYFRFPQVTRPFDTPTLNGEIPDEHPIESVARLFEFTRRIQHTVPDIPVIGNGYSWLRQFIGYAGAANIADGSVTMMGIGREAFAYPDAPKDLLEKGQMDPKKVCIACSKCTQIMRDGGRTGCVIRDTEVYVPLYNEAREKATAAGK
ncbi:NADH oxidase [Oxobacter pfennigii]|uniref:NADH oxidase n=1 Tax=Oxobacter pfennigii TaxID=36849 RepID=A0A0P8W769_9CLOT|nr:NADH:flavin oxidoreductase [Oxobacter pfennigii]KPU44518.1 NADH oxidase [Oxobacter pfennigii]